jgi:Carboxylesterase family
MLCLAWKRASHAALAQSVEHLTRNEKVISSILIGGSLSRSANRTISSHGSLNRTNSPFALDLPCRTPATGAIPPLGHARNEDVATFAHSVRATAQLAMTTTTRSTASGEVRGNVLPSGVLEFLGIPFAAPPVGALRFQPPVPHDAWDGEWDATEYGPTAPQFSAEGPMTEILPNRIAPGDD